MILLYGEGVAGVGIEVDEDTEFESEYLATVATSAIQHVIACDIDFDTGATSLFTPDLQTSVIPDLLASPFPNAEDDTVLTEF